VQSECLPFSRIPHSTALFEAFLHDFARVRPFYSRPPLDTTWLPAQAAALGFDKDRRARVSSILLRQNQTFGASPKALANIDRLRLGACAAVTGQQVGLFGGPLFAILKALTAVRLAEESTRKGYDCVPLFWLATEDHDLAEVQNAVLPSSDGSLHTLTAQGEGTEHAPVGQVRFTPQIEQVVEQAAEILGSAEVVEALRLSYRPGASFGEAFGKLLARVFSDSGVILLDAADPELHQIAAPVYADSIRRAAELDSALLARGEALRQSGFHEQVKVTASSTLLFALRDGARTVVHRVNGDFTIGDERLTERELLDRIDAHPEEFSPNVLLRPVVQDFLLPTLAYIGGPAEVAYFAQASVVYEQLLGRATPVWPRASMTLVEPHARRLLERYGLSLTDLFGEADQLQALLAARVLPGDVQQSFQAATESLEQSLKKLTDALERLDPTLVEAARRAGEKMHYQLNRLQTRAAGAEVRRDEVLTRHASQLSSALFPNHNLQERVTGGIYFLARYPDLIPLLHDAVSLACPDHQIVYL
jgi:bacillithiol biosynthesis cysteine-adding enzyme BshC